MAEPEVSSAAAGGGGRLRNAFGGVLCAFTLLLIGVVAFSIRLFSVIKYESVIHEFDPYFNFRVTQFLSKNGIYEFWNWFDDRTWYPLGRVHLLSFPRDTASRPSYSSPHAPAAALLSPRGGTALLLSRLRSHRHGDVPETAPDAREKNKLPPPPYLARAPPRTTPAADGSSASSSDCLPKHPHPPSVVRRRSLSPCARTPGHRQIRRVLL